MHAQNRKHAFTTLFNLFLYLTDEPICIFFQCQKLGNGPWVGKCPTPGTNKAGKCPAVAWAGGGGWAQVELTDALFLQETRIRKIIKSFEKN